MAGTAGYRGDWDDVGAGVVVMVGGVVVVVVVVVLVVLVVVTGTEAAAWAGRMIDCTTGRVHFAGRISVAIAAPPTAIPLSTRLRSGFSAISHAPLLVGEHVMRIAVRQPRDSWFTGPVAGLRRRP